MTESVPTGDASRSELNHARAAPSGAAGGYTVRRMSPTPTRTSTRAPAGDVTPKAARRDRRLGELPMMASARTLDSPRSERPLTDSTPLTARAKGFEADADMIELTPTSEEAGAVFFFACSHARDRNAEARAATATRPSATKQRDATLST